MTLFYKRFMHENDIKILKINNVKYSVFLNFLKYLYTGIFFFILYLFYYIILDHLQCPPHLLTMLEKLSKKFKVSRLEVIKINIFKYNIFFFKS